MAGCRRDAPVDSGASAAAILDRWCGALAEARDACGGARLGGVGFAMPGPFDYPGGISLIRGLGKYESLYGRNIRAEVRERLALAADVPIQFANDAECFLLGECWRGALAGMPDAMGITLGTGFGSAFLRGGEVATTGGGVPPDGWLYNAPFRGATAEDHFSGRGLLALHNSNGGNRAESPREIAARAGGGDARALEVFRQYGELLAEFLDPWSRAFRPLGIVIGGSVARSWRFFGPSLTRAMAAGGLDFPLRPSALFEEAALLGAARMVSRPPQLSQKDS